MTNDVNGGPSGVGIASAAGKAAFWDIVGAPMGTPKIIAFEGEFAMTEGHAQELKTQAHRAPGGQAPPDLPVRQQRRHRRLADRRRRAQQVLRLPLDRPVDLVRLERLLASRTATTTTRSSACSRPWRTGTRRIAGPMIVIGTTTKGYWPSAVNGKIPGAGDQVVGYPSHPYAMKMNSEYFVALARTFEERYGVEFSGIRQGPVTDPRERLHPVQDQHRRRHVGARPQWSRGLAGRSPGGDRRLCQGRASRSAST